MTTTPLNKNRTKDRIKQTGEVFTPRKLVLEMLDKLPEDTWLPEKTFLDNSCGNGNFIVEIIIRKIEKDLTIIEALETTYGLDLMPDNVEDCHKRILDIVGDTKEYRDIVTHNIVCHDALNGWDYENWCTEEETSTKNMDQFCSFD